ncbi:membrane-bound PQQ-dependent dehydrogenase, glucose/quinate/shikimate family [Komagataeibacter xylinus]|uniref:Membrane-bound PQQ-dependent dehydrogenase, glucose/quinate/shikimate family n=1 Tax=Komagataeibacter xylinus TaxID=28448 RepID=A0A318Q5E1_KOMXY|nr:glucose/quinate/shikimate family membrane-bound PQQ-dependent dehydrogenase [Komagataeibacter xylinus]AZV38054.1 glucose/quinate/shikimate family membrane-bound PQQ-dependent dehydrogenase [Komagataeibacter xylinus]PYD58120.1 membrane-bound PQQ-dependent dehydrogenase, glucose/quinate/shikimate family [Komagataeibacter xylinus]GBQ67310.1 PQQ-dependent membrane-bound glucose dehydrogenase [Komagataeibacter xylinus NBRC 15237]
MNSLMRSAPLLAAAIAVCALTGLYLLGGGLWLCLIGGSFYYVVAGVLLLVTAVLLARRQAMALTVYAVLLLGTMVWAVQEAGFDFWALAPRGDILVPIGIVLALPWVTRHLQPASPATHLPLFGAIGAAVVVVGAALTQDPQDIAGSLPPVAQNAPEPGDAHQMPDEDWQAYGRTQFGDRFSPLKQVNASNVGKLKVAWTFRTGDLRGPNDPGEITDEVTPIKIRDTLYLCTPHQILFALDAKTGQQRWKFDPKLAYNPTFQHLTCRGVSYHEDRADDAQAADGAAAPAECARRIFLPTNDGQLFALDAATGARCASFGNNGVVNLQDGMPVKTLGFYEPTSPPVVTDTTVIVSGAVTDNYSTHEPSGVTRGFDVHTGALKWAFDPGNPDPNEMPSEHHTFVPNSPNSWITSSYDAKLDLIYIPMGVQTPDIWGGNRGADAERYASSIVALNATTGRLVWSYQTVHHDLWDMDIPAQPSLVDIRNEQGEVIPTLYAPAKTGNIFVLDRRNGQPVVPAPEHPVPQGAAPGDHVSPTQPFSELSFRPKKLLTDADMWGGTMYDQLVCRIMFHRLRYEGTFTPPSLQGTLVFPGNLGMFEWGGLAVDPVRQIAIANPIAIPFVSKLIPRGPNNPATPDKSLPSGSESGVQPQFGVPYGVDLHPFLSPFGLPCKQPAWGYMSGIDLRTNKIVWKHRNGTIRDSAPLPLPIKMGVPSLGGPLTTAGGVAFLTSTLDYYIRAYDVTNGQVLWQDRLPAGGQSTPMTYAVDGKQYIVTADGGHGSFGTKLGDYIVAYSLPDGN